jgi:hypothetical protein
MNWREVCWSWTHEVEESVLGWKGSDSSDSSGYVPSQNHLGRENWDILQLVSNSSGDEDIDEVSIPFQAEIASRAH